MRKFAKHLFATAAVAFVAGAAHAADMAVPPPPPPVVAPVVPFAAGWYLRGDIGVGIMHSGTWRETEFDDPLPGYKGRWLHQSMGDTTFAGAGVGYQFTDFFRADITTEYRSAVSVKGIGSLYGLFGTTTGTAYGHLDGQVASAVSLVNGYVDLGSYWGLSPYLGAGLGASYNMFSGATQVATGLAAGGSGRYKDRDQWDFAWALQAGLGYQVNDQLKLEIGYRYLDMGDARTGGTTCYTAAGPINSAGCRGKQETWGIKDLASSDIRLGMRWMLQPPVAPAPVVAKF